MDLSFCDLKGKETQTVLTGFGQHSHNIFAPRCTCEQQTQDKLSKGQTLDVDLS